MIGGFVMAQETLDRRSSAVERRLGKLETKVRDLDTGYGTATYQMDRDMIRANAMLERLAADGRVSMITEEEIDTILEERS